VNFLFLVTVLEIFLGGGGRLVAFGPVTLRMILLAVCLILTVIDEMLRRHRSDGQWLGICLLLAYLLVHLPALLIGGYRGAEPAQMFTELQQSLYWVAAPFFAIELQSRQMVQRVGRLVQFSGLFLAIAYLVVLEGAASGTIDAHALFAALSDASEVSARAGGLFYYKGFVYLGAGTVFLLAQRGRYSMPLALFVFSALVLTLTRGFMLSTAVTVLILLLYQRRMGAFTVGVLVMLSTALIMYAFLPAIDTSVTGNWDISNNQRLDDMSFISSHLTASSLFFGEGFGSLINERSNIENTFLWALWKLGIAGVIFWTMPLILCWYYFARIPNRATNGLACGFFFGTVYIYIETITNPYLNNPIGLVFVMLAIFSLRTLAKIPPRDVSPQFILGTRENPQGAL
jgi:hypothetical protein